MNFISWAFVFLFIPVFVLRNVIGREKNERAFMSLVMIASTIFVMWHVPIYILIMLTSIGVDYVAAIVISRAPPGALRRRLFLILSMTVNLALLGFFKYTNFFLETSEHLIGMVARPPHLPRMGLVLPMGISFYTFGSMSYTIDVYRNRIKPVKRFSDFYYFVTFFPHLVAGPIIRAEQFFYQLPRRRRLWMKVFNEGAFLIARGVFLKMVVADNIAMLLNTQWDILARTGNGTTSLLMMLLFGGQIFCDFEGYSSIARGLAYWMGYRFPLNFDNPYIAGSFSNFWERWHITLSRWLRDYLYIPLGGNRGSLKRTYANLLIVMLLGGLWHGASITFVIWGAIHGGALAIERLLGLQKVHREGGPILRFAWYLVVQGTVMIAWVFFRCNSLIQARLILSQLFHLRFGPVDREMLLTTLFLVPVVVVHVHGYLVEKRIIPPLSRLQKGMLAGAMVFFALVCYGGSSDFIYFQF
jgi:alginate O-acetyltransferase complex protein AlgI